MFHMHQNDILDHFEDNEAVWKAKRKINTVAF